MRLQAEPEYQMNLKEDQALILDRGPDEDDARSAAHIIGQPLPTMERGMVVI